MGLTLDTIVPWGRSLAEYRQMFSLADSDLGQRILGCADGPAAFNAELTTLGGRVTSIDPLYAFTQEQIRKRITATSDTILAQVQQHQADYVWSVIPSVEALGTIRMAAMKKFLADYEAGKAAGRYIVGSLPSLPFTNTSFDLALVSHLLFLYSDHLTVEFHWQSIQELLRVATEVRIFPLVTLDGRRSPYLSDLLGKLTQAGHLWCIQSVEYEFQRGGNQMLVARSRS
jgi:hypothetical protein